MAGVLTPMAIVRSAAWRRLKSQWGRHSRVGEGGMAVSREPRDPRGRRVTGTHKTLSQKGSPALQMQIEELA